MAVIEFDTTDDPATRAAKIASIQDGDEANFNAGGSYAIHFNVNATFTVTTDVGASIRTMAITDGNVTLGSSVTYGSGGFDYSGPNSIITVGGSGTANFNGSEGEGDGNQVWLNMTAGGTANITGADLDSYSSAIFTTGDNITVNFQGVIDGAGTAIDVNSFGPGTAITIQSNSTILNSTTAIDLSDTASSSDTPVAIENNVTFTSNTTNVNLGANAVIGNISQQTPDMTITGPATLPEGGQITLTVSIDNAVYGKGALNGTLVLKNGSGNVVITGPNFSIAEGEKQATVTLSLPDDNSYNPGRTDTFGVDNVAFASPDPDNNNEVNLPTGDKSVALGENDLDPGSSGGGSGGSGGGDTSDPTTPPTTSAGQNISGSDGADSLVGDTGNDTLLGGGGPDTLFGGNGSDVVYGNQGPDVIYGNPDSDTIYGGQDADTVYGGQDADVVYGNLADDVLYGNLGEDTTYGGQGDDTIYGGQGDDQNYGNLGNDVLHGNLGNDTNVGGGGDDLLFGEDGNDLLEGGEGNDTLSGGEGNDTLSGGAGDDLLNGGTGADVIDFSGMPAAGNGNDTIADFSAEDGDIIRISAAFQDSVSASVDEAGNTVLDLGNGNTIALLGVPEFNPASIDYV